MTGVEAGGRSLAPGEHAARFQGGSVGVLQGTKTYILQNQHGQIENTHSISAGLDYAGVGPEHAMLKERGRVQYTSASDEQAFQAFHALARFEGIIPALESSHAIAYVLERAPQMKSSQVVVNLSGRGDNKDLASVLDIWRQETMTGGRLLKKGGKPKLVAYLVAGDPSLEVTETAVEELVRNGVDVLELGVPFTDAMADGPVIQAASERAALLGISLPGVLELASRLRKKYSDLGLVLFTYYNPVFKMGLDAFADAANLAGVDAILRLISRPKRRPNTRVF